MNLNRNQNGNRTETPNRNAKPKRQTETPNRNAKHPTETQTETGSPRLLDQRLCLIPFQLDMLSTEFNNKGTTQGGIMTRMGRWLLTFLCLAFSLQAQAANKEWTVLVYLNGFNDLDAAGKMNLNQMESVGSSDQVNVVVEWGSISAPTSTKRMLVAKDSDINKVTSPVLEELGKVDMGDPATLKTFLNWGIQKFPANHYLVVVWDHGSGWHLTGSNGHVHAQDISWDDLSGNAITTEDLGRVIREVSQDLGRKIDIYSSDACLMAMGEVAGEMSGAIDYFAGSQELEPDSGWPYDVILADLVANPGQSPADLANLIAKSYVKSYEGSDDATFSVLDMSQFARFEGAAGAFADALASLSKTGRAATLKQVKVTQSYSGDYGDLGDFARRLQGKVGIDAAVIANVQQALHNLVIANYMTDKYPNTHGLSVWLPLDAKTYRGLSKPYSGLTFEHDSHWSKAISSYLNLN
jgi:hypothetical protein